MGQESSKPMSQQLPHLLTQLYQPHTHNHRFPGKPHQLSLSQQPSSLKKNPNGSQLEPFIDRYDCELNLTEEQALNQKRIYSQRKHCLPWHVKILGCELAKDQCHCANNKYRATVFTEHIETRLCNFKVVCPSGFKKQGDLETLDSFNLNQAIYVLINALHGYQLLMEQFKVNYPSVFSIGITRKAQVKVWVCDHWGLNQESARSIPENLVIEEIITLIDQRSKESLGQLLNSRYNYMNWTFDSLQQKLAHHTISFSQGKKSLESRILQRVNTRQKSVKKFPLNRTSTQQSSKFSLKLPPYHPSPNNTDRDTNKIPTSERRRPSQQLQRSVNQSHIKVAPNYQVLESPGRATVFQSPKKTVKFVYSQQQQFCSRVPSQQHSPKLSVPTYASSQVRDSQRYQTSQDISLRRPQVNSVPIIQKESQKTLLNDSCTPHSYPSPSNPKFQEEIVDQKNKNSRHSSYMKRSRPLPICVENLSLDQLEKVESTNLLKQTEEISDSQRGKKVVFAEGTISGLGQQGESPKNEASLTEITAEFKNLLRSDKKLEEEEEVVRYPEVTSYEKVALQYENSEQSEKRIGEARMFNEKSEQLLPSHWEIHFESIKEVDEDVSYSVDDKD